MISEIGEGVAKMASLQVLRLENNRIEALPDQIGSCRALVKLDLGTNNLHSLPESMGQFRKLQRLNVANNMLRRVPASMGSLKTLKELDLRYLGLCLHCTINASLCPFEAACVKPELVQGQANSLRAVRYNNLDELYHSKSEEGLSRLLAFLREEEERERLELIERLKPIGTQVRHTLSSCLFLQCFRQSNRHCMPCLAAHISCQAISCHAHLICQYLAQAACLHCHYHYNM